MTPQLQFAYEALVEIATRRDLGATPLGHRYMIDILGGTFEGPGLKGRVLPGGADRQLLRPDGVKLLDALYEMETDDGAVLTVHNQVTIDEQAPGGRYARSVVRITAPVGAYEWLNRRVFVGTVQGLMPERPAVRIRVYRVD